MIEQTVEQIKKILEGASDNRMTGEIIIRVVLNQGGVRDAFCTVGQKISDFKKST